MGKSYCCDVQTCLAILACVLFMVFFKIINREIPQLRLLFTNDTNRYLLITIIILTLFLNTPVGVMLVLIFSYLYYIFQNNIEPFEDSVTSEEMSNEILKNLKNSITTEEMDNITTEDMDRIEEEFESNNPEEEMLSEELENNNPNLPEINTEEGFTNMNRSNQNIESKNKLLINSEEDINEMVNKNLNRKLFCEKDLLTQVGPNDKQGYDISGCRYDMKLSPQNLTKNGPPVSFDKIYKKEDILKRGTAFYPLNG